MTVDATPLTLRASPARPWVVAESLDKVFAYAASRGVDRQALLHRAGLREPRAHRVPVAHLLALHQAAELALGDPLFGHHLALTARLDDFAPIAYLSLRAPTLRVAWERAAGLYALWSSAQRLLVRESADQVEIQYQSGPGEPHTLRHDVDLTLAVILSFSRQLSRSALRPLRVVVCHRYPTSARSEVERFFAAPIEEGGRINSLFFPAAALEVPLASAAGAVSGASVSARDLVTAILARHHRPRAASLQEVAHQLNQSPRSLQRALAAEHTSFRALLQEVLTERSAEMLERPDLSLAEIAYLLGFSEASAFTRAYRGWHGNPPSTRRRASGPAGYPEGSPTR